MTMTQEKPILFSGPMVSAILAGRKTVTRRVVKPQPIIPSRNETTAYIHDARIANTIAKCPYGAVGDWLWVREAWSPDHKDFYPNFPIVYRAEGGIEIENGKVFSPEAKRSFPFKWRPSIHMPRAASRLTLEIVKVGVERLQEITGKEIIAEGAVSGPHYNEYLGKMPVSAFDGGAYPDLISLFAAGWEKINGKGSWASNPFCWVISFKRLTA